MKALLDKIKSSESIILSTHRTPDGDGLGSEVAIYHALKRLGKKVRLVHVDKPAFKYQFLTKKVNIEVFHPEIEVDCDLFMIFDTNDARMIPGLWEQVKKTSGEIAFIDHHPILQEAPGLDALSFVDTKAASTGEIAFKIIRDLGVSWDENIAEALYTSICFDTQLFRYIKSSAISHQIAAEVIPYIDTPEKIHDYLFGNIPVEKFRFISHCTNNIEFKFNNQLAFLEVTDQDLIRFNISNEDTRDLTDQILGIDSVEIALVVTPSEGAKKLSFRSKKPIEVLSAAKKWNGGGHPYASGALVKDTHPDFHELKQKLIAQLGELL